MWRRARRLVVSTLSGAAVGVLGACAPSTSEFKSDAEDFLRSDEMFDTYGLDLPEPTCTEPDDVDSGGTVTCTATSQDDQTYIFRFEITGPSELTLRSIELGAG